MQPIHIAAKNGCLEILKYIASLPGVDLSAVISTVKHKINIVQMLLLQMRTQLYICTFILSGKSSSFAPCLSDGAFVVCESTY